MAEHRSLSATDWLLVAYEAMVEGGLGAISVEALARRLGVTKGSFYWHFKNKEALLRGLLEMWEQEGTRQVIAALEQIEDPRARLIGLITAAWERMDHVRAEAILQAAAASNDPIISPYYERITRARLAYTTSLYQQMGHDASMAAHWGRTAYGAYLGTIQLVATLPDTFADQEALDAYVAHLKRVLLPGVDMNI